MAKFVTRENVLAMIESMGLDEKGQSNPGTYAHEDRHRAAAHIPKYEACREAWRDIFNGANSRICIEKLEQLNIGRARLLRIALTGEFEQTEEWLRNPPKGYHWVTFKGDFYGISVGDHLNLPSVARLANDYLPEEKQVLEGSKAIAEMMPNPCTRITRAVQFS